MTVLSPANGGGWGGGGGGGSVGVCGGGGFECLQREKSLCRKRCMRRREEKYSISISNRAGTGAENRCSHHH